jgi:hypothetical protein
MARSWKLKVVVEFKKATYDAALRLIDQALESPIDEQGSAWLKRTKDLILLRNQGNNAFAANKQADAISHYTDAIALDTENLCLSILHGNRSAAYFNVSRLIVRTCLSTARRIASRSWRLQQSACAERCLFESFPPKSANLLYERLRYNLLTLFSKTRSI